MRTTKTAARETVNSLAIGLRRVPPALGLAFCVPKVTVLPITYPEAGLTKEEIARQARRVRSALNAAHYEHGLI